MARCISVKEFGIYSRRAAFIIHRLLLTGKAERRSRTQVQASSAQLVRSQIPPGHRSACVFLLSQGGRRRSLPRLAQHFRKVSECTGRMRPSPRHLRSLIAPLPAGSPPSCARCRAFSRSGSSAKNCWRSSSARCPRTGTRCRRWSLRCAMVRAARLVSP